MKQKSVTALMDKEFDKLMDIPRRAVFVNSFDRQCHLFGLAGIGMDFSWDRYLTYL